MTVLRAKGFEGTSMSDLSEATGLKKASLYHRFPGGKKEMVEAVMSYTRDWGQSHIFAILTNNEKTPKERITEVLENIRNLYDGGKSICILRSLTTDSSLPLFGPLIEESFALWIKAFSQLGIDTGLEEAQAQKLATESLIKIQGSLILAKAMDNNSVFQQSLSDIKKQYI